MIRRMIARKSILAAGLAFTSLSGCIGGGGGGEPRALPPLAAGPEPTYADLVTYGESAQLVVIATVEEALALAPERAPDLAPDRVRLYVQAQTEMLVAGRMPVGSQLTYLVDLPRDSDGNVPDIEGAPVILFARSVPERPGFLQLISSEAHLPATPGLRERVRIVMEQLLASDPPPVVTGIRDGLAVAGNLAGESETQLFLDTRSRDPATITVLRRPGREPTWGVSFGEIVDQSARAPASETLAWYRLACALPASLPASVTVPGSISDRQRAAADYAFVIESLGPCTRNR